MVSVWKRKCQECLDVQADKEPQGLLTDAYANRKCKKCKSEALDFGRLVTYDNDGKVVNSQE